MTSVAALSVALCSAVAAAAPLGGVPTPEMFGYAAGPVQHNGTAAGKAHRVPASATRAHPAAGSIKGHPAPAPDLAPPPMGTRARVRTGPARMAAGHQVAGHRAVGHTAGTAPAATTSPAPPPPATRWPSATPSPGPPALPASSPSSARSSGVIGGGGGTDNASYSVAAAFDTVPMANQSGRIAVTLTNTGTSTWGKDSFGFTQAPYALGTLVFPAADTTGTGTPLTKGTSVVFRTTVAPGQTVTVESATPPENPGSYTICGDMVNPAGRYFSDEGGNEYCAPYAIQQYPAAVSEQEPLPGTDVDTQTPQLSASATVPGGYPAVPAFSFAFRILDGPNPGTAKVLQSSGWVADNGSSWTPPTALTWGTTYYWQVTVSDASPPPSLGLGTTWTTPISFVVGNAQPTITSRLGNAYQADDGNPIMTSTLGGTDYSGSGKTVDPKTGNVSQQVTDADVATAGLPLSVTRTYNSLDPRTSQALGAGWSSLLDMSLVPDADGSGALVLTKADGQQVRFAKNAAGGYAPPQDMYAVVTALSGGGFSVTDQADTSYAFGQASGSSWLLSKITDDQGRTETFGYSSGALATITNTTSGRALHLSWATPSGAAWPHVASVSTDPVAAGRPGTALTWTYGYSGDLLAKVCPPGTASACTSYGYTTSGSHAPTAVLNANPTSYYRLDDPASASAAANQIPVNDLTTTNPPATEMNTTPGVAGPVPGVTATGFDGSSSFIPLDGAWCTTPGQQSSCIPVGGTGRVLASGGAAESLGVSIWFKTAVPSGVLLGLTSVLPPSQNCTPHCIAGDATPLLWIDSFGALDGYSGSAAAMSSPAAVDDGNWHQAVLIPGQSLFVDGTRVATAAAGFTAPANAAYALLGAGLIPQSVLYSSWSFFSGSMADVSVYHNQLPSVAAVAAQYAAQTHPAAELTSVTSPGGRGEFAASYDTVNDRVASLTDAHGGTWSYGGPVPGASSAAYDGAVLGSSPEDFWPLGDAAGPLAHDMVNGAVTAASPRPATYANVTLGVPGPTGFPDGSAAGFTGSGSQISIPGGYFAATGGGGESVELWFAATTPGSTLLSASTPQNGGAPPALWIDSNGCLQGSIGATMLTTSFVRRCAVDDGKWHQLVLTLGPVTTTTSTLFPGGGGPGTSTQAATLYMDGAVIATVQAAPFTAASTGYTAYIGNGADGDFTGSMADVSFYTSQLTSTDVTAHYNALHNQVSVQVPSGNPLQPPTYLATPTLNTQAIAVTDPVGKNATYLYASGALVRTTDALGGVTSYGYDAARRASTVTDPDGDTTYTTHDAYNNVTSTTTCAATSNCQTSYTSYYENLSGPIDPRNNKPTDSRDARSSSPFDPAYDTVTTYTAVAQIATRTTPPTSACPKGCTTTYAYTSGTEPAVGGGIEPGGLVASITAPSGGVTGYAYDSAGDVMQTTDPLGMVTRFSYDSLGRPLTATQVSGTYPAGLTTSYAYDSQDRVLSQTDPPVTDRVTGAIHTMVTTRGYDADSNVLTTTISDSTGGDPPRTTTDAYNADGDLASTTDALGNTTSYTYDGFGDRTSKTTPAGLTTAYAYDAAGNLLTTTLQGYTGNPGNPSPPTSLVQESRAYDPAGRLASVTSVRGTQTSYTYYGDNRLAASYVVAPGSSTGMADVHTYGYDSGGNRITQTAPGGLVVTTAYDADNKVLSQTQDPAGVDRTVTASYDADGNIVAESLTGGTLTQTETMTYNAMDQRLSQTIGNTGGNLTTSYVRDQRGLVISQTDPAGNTTTIANDEAGRPAAATAPAVQSQTGSGAAPVTASPVTMTGYDTFGDKVETSDANGNVTTVGYDSDGRQASSTDPSYTPPGASTPVSGTTATTYNNLGQETSTTDPLGNTTHMSYDQLGDLASQTDPGAGVSAYAYDAAGEQTGVTDPTGAQTQSTYDSLGHLVTTTELVRQNTSAAYTTSYAYNDAGEQVSQTSPAGVTAKAGYDAVGQETSSTDGAGNTATYAYDLDGHLVRTTLPDGTAAAAAYDLAGRQTALSDVNAAGTVLRTESAVYNPDGQVTAATDFMGNTTTAAYDATGMLTSMTQPVSAGKSITVSYGYDLAGHRTALTDGNGTTTYTTYNPLGLPQAITEPPTAAHSSAADSTTTDIYNANGDLVTQNLPGRIQVSNAYDAMGDLKGQSGTGASAPTAARTFSYDAAGRLLTAATGAAGTSGTFGYQPATSESFGYDDRGLLLSASGSAGTSAFTYNASGQLASAAEAAGTSSYGYDSAGRLATDADPASGTTGTYSYNSLTQVTQVSYGTGNDTRSLGYDALHRLTSDTIATAGGTQVAALGYGYDASSDLTSMTTSGLATSGGGAGAVTSTYGYDQADRLTSWTATPAGGSSTTKTYGYDNNGNLTSNNGVTASYDARNELTSDGNGNTYAYAANGDLTGQASAGNSNYSFSSDAYGQQITDGFSSFSWDALNRVVSAGEAFNTSYNISLTYDGMTSQVASDSSAAYSRDPSGQIVGVDTPAGLKTLALSNSHDDLSGTFTATGAAMTGSTTYDPWGQVLASTGPAIQVGYQGQWTDPVTQQVSMGSRFYRPPAGGFINQDTYTGAEGGPAVSDNLHAYADDNPMTVTDPTGHAPAGKGGGGGSITEAQVRAAWARAGALQKKAAAAGIAAAGAAGEAAVAKAAAFAAATLASALNTAAQVAEWAANKAAQAAAFAFQKAQAMLQQAEEWQRRADDAWASARQHLDASHGWNPFSDAANAWDAAKETGIAVYDEAQAGLRYAAYGVLEGAAIGLQFAADQLRDAAHLAKEKAQSAARFAHKAATLASQLWRSAVNLAGYARAMEGAALAAASYAASLAGEYAAQQARKAIKKAGRLLRKVGRELKKIGKQAGRIATRVAKAWYKYSGTQDVVSCVTHGNGSSCAKVAVTVALTVVNAAQGGLDPATDGAEVAVLASDAGAAAAEEAGSTAAEQAGSTAARDAAESCGLSFTASTMVLLASGKAVPISALKPGEKVLATNTKTGKTQAQTIAAVLVNHDTSLYDLTVRANGRTATIHTTSNHPFWDATTGRWVKAGALKYGTYLRVPSGRTATVLGGTVPAASSGDMWDLTVLNDHDFYVQAATIAILAHNCAAPAAKPSGNFWQRHPKLTAYVFAGLKLVNHTKVIEDGTAGYQTPPAETAIERFVDEATSDPFKFKRP